MDPKDLLAMVRKAVETSSGGQLTTEQAKKFFDTVVQQDEFISKIQTVNMTSSTYQLNTIGVASRVMRGAAEGTAPEDTVGVTITPRTLTTKEVILPFDVTFSFLEENIEGGNAKTLLNTLFAKSFKNDTLDLAINGDESSQDNFLKMNDGWLTIADDDSTVHDYTIAASPTWKTVFSGMLALMPTKWRGNVSELCFLVAPDVEQAYRDELGARNTALGDSMIVDNRGSQYNGITIVPCPFMPGGASPKVLLTKYQNLAIGIGRDMRFGSQIQERKRVIEYTITAKIDFNYVSGDMIVLGQKA